MASETLVKPDARSRVKGACRQHGGRLPRRATCLAAVLAIAGLTFALPSSHAANITWSGATDTVWGTGGNWAGGTAPANNLTGDTAVFDSASYTNQPSAAARSVAGISIGASSGAVTINTLTTTSRLAVGSGGITMAAGAGSLTLGVDSTDGVLIGASQTWTNESASALSWRTINTTTNLGTVTLTLSGTGGGGFSQLENSIQQGTNSVLAIVVDYAGSGTVLMDKSSNTFSGGLTIKRGNVVVNQTNGTGSGSVTLGYNGGSANATLTSANVSTARTYASAFVLASGHAGDLTIASTGAAASGAFGATFTGGVTGTNNLIVVASSANTNQTSIQFTTTGLNFTGNLTKRGDKTAALGAANTFGGIALVEAGTLRLDHVDALQNASLDTGTSGSQAVTFSGTALTYTLGGLQGADALAITSTNTIRIGNNNASTTFSGVISGSGGAVTKTGNGRLTLAAANTYSGATSITGGILEAASAGTINSTTGVTVNGSGAEFKYNSATALTKPLTLTQGTLSGTGTISSTGGVLVATNAILSPGNSPGTQTFTTGLTLSPGGTYVWETNSGTGTKGVNWDVIDVTGGGLNLSSLSGAATFSLDLTTLTASGSSGPMDNYTPGGSYTWRIFDATTLTLPGSFGSAPYAPGTDITSLFSLVTTNWKNTVPAENDISIKVATDGTGIDLIVVPEPATLVLAGLGVGLAGLLVRHRRRPL